MKQIIAFFLVLSLLSSCIKKKDDCDITSQPITDNSIVTNSANFTYCEYAVFRQKKDLELYYTIGDCNNASINTEWTYTGQNNRVGQSNSSSSFIDYEFMTSGTICAQLMTESQSSEKACREIIVLRNNVWGETTNDFSGNATVQSITLTINGDVYSGFGNFNEWYKFDTTSWTWIEKSAIPNLVDFGAFGGFVINDFAYIIGNNSSVYKYTVSTDAWENIGTFPENVSTMLDLQDPSEYPNPVVGESVNGKGYFGVGRNGRFYEYDPGANTWTQKATYPETTVINKHIFPYQNRIYVGRYYYDVATDSWVTFNIDFSRDNFAPGFVQFGNLMYSSQNGETVTFDGSIVTVYDPNGPNKCSEVVSPIKVMAQGAVTGNFAIFPKLAIPSQGNTSAHIASNIVSYYVLQ